MKNVWLCAAILLLGLACADPEPPMAQYAQNNGRWTLQRDAEFGAFHTYYGVREVYILTDRETGRQWVGVTGIGIAELIVRSNGKTPTTREE